MRGSALSNKGDSDVFGDAVPVLGIGAPARLLAVAALFLLAGCANQPGGGPGPMEPGEPDDEIELIIPERELTAWEKVAEGVEEDGTVSKEVALQAFALTLGDIPGVTPPTANEVGVKCGSAALKWVSRHVDELTEEELAAIEAVVVGDAAKSADGTKITQFGDHSCTIGNSSVSEDQDGAEVYRPILDQELSKLEQAFGRPLGIPVYITLGTGKASSTVLAWASPQTSGNCGFDPATSCRVQILTNKTVGAGDAELRAILSHELAHCFQSTWMAVTDALTQPDWVSEGFAEYAGQSRNPMADRVPFKIYTQTPLKALFVRDYDGSGFFFHLHTLGIPVFQRIRDAFILSTSVDIFGDLIAPNESEFGNTWASAMTMDPARGDAWHMPEAPPDAVSSFPMGVLDNGKSFKANAEVGVTRLAHVEFESDIVRFAATGGRHGRISWDNGGENLLTEIDGQAYCRLAAGCECPAGTTGSPPQTPIPSIAAMISASGTTQPTELTVTGVPLDAYCRRESQPEPPPSDGVDPCIVGTWESNDWILPGPLPSLNGRGGNDAVLTIRSSGAATWNFNSMQPITSIDSQINVVTEQYTRGSASAVVMAMGGDWEVSEVNTSNMEGFAIDNIIGEYPLAGGPGLFVGLRDGSYTCSGGILSYSTTDPVEGGTISVTFSRK